MRRIYWIVITLSVLSITLTIILIIKSIELKKWTGDIPVEEFYDMDYSDQSYHINDFRNFFVDNDKYNDELAVMSLMIANGKYINTNQANVHDIEKYIEKI